MDETYRNFVDNFQAIAKEILVESEESVRPLKHWIAKQDSIVCNFMLVLAGARLSYLVNCSKPDRIDFLLQATNGRLVHIRRLLGKYDASYIVRSDRVDEFQAIMNGNESNMEKTGKVLEYPYSAKSSTLRSWKFMTYIFVKKETSRTEKHQGILYCFASPEPVDISERIERYNAVLNSYGYTVHVEYTKRDRI